MPLSTLLHPAGPATHFVPRPRRRPLVPLLITAAAVTAWLALAVNPVHAQRESPGHVDDAFHADTSGFGGVSGVLAQPDGRLLLGGSSPGDQLTVAATGRLVRLRPDGSADPGFKTNLGSLFRNAAALAVQPDGKIIVGGTYTDPVGGIIHGRLVRLQADGSLDRGFAVNSFDFSGPSRAIIQSDGRIVLGGIFTRINGAARTGLARLHTDGSLDAGFDPGLRNSVSALAVQPDGRLVVGSSFYGVPAGSGSASVARLEADGTLDPSFTPVDAFTDGAGRDLAVDGIAVQPDGRIVLGGRFNRVNGGRDHVNLARVNADGTVDPTFNTAVDRMEPVAVNMAGIQVLPVFVQSDGRILLAGAFDRVNGLPAVNVARLNADGSLDRGFDAGENPFAAAGSFLTGEEATPDGRQLVLVGAAESRLNPPPLVVRLFAGPTDPVPLPVLSGPGQAVSAVGNPYFSYRIVASDSPRAYSATGLPAGLSLNTATGLIGGVPLASGTYEVALGATNVTGTGTATLNLTILTGNTGTPTLSVSQDTTTVSRGAGEVATVTFTRSGGDLALPLKVAYTLAGPLIGGTDYVTLPGTKKIKAGRASASFTVQPLPGGANGKVKLVVVSGPGYLVDSGAKVRVKVTD